MKASTVLLHDDTRDNVFERLVQFCQGIENRFDNVRRPRVDFGLLVRLRANGGLDRFFDHIGHFVNNETGVICVIHGSRATISKEKKMEKCNEAERNDRCRH